MAMVEGSVTVNPATGSVVKSGCCGEVFDVLLAGSDFGTLQVDNPPAYAAAVEQLAVLARAIAKVIPHVQTNAVVTTSVTVTSVSGVTTGGGVSGPGSGSGSGTIA